MARRLAAEFLGTALLLATVVGSGIQAERLAAGNVALALLCNALATGAGLLALILALGPVSGAHFNPAVTLTAAWQRELPWPLATGYVAAQGLGGLVGVAAAHLMFELPVWTPSRHARTGQSQWLAEFIATFGLLLTIRTLGHWATQARVRAEVVAGAVAAYIVAAYWFTASTSFANPAVTFARAWTDTFAGIRPSDVPAFVLAQLAGAFSAVALCRWLTRGVPA